MRDELREIKPGKLVRRLDNDSTLLSPEMTLWEFDFYTFFFFFQCKHICRRPEKEQNDSRFGKQPARAELCLCSLKQKSEKKERKLMATHFH